MKMKQSAAFAAAIVAASLAFSLSASEEEAFTRLDANGDGAISTEEAQVDPTLSAHWSATDANQDGQIDQAEFSAFEAQSMGGMKPEEGK